MPGPIVTAELETQTSAHGASTLVAAVADRILRALDGNNPTAPPVQSPAALVLLAAVRRELSGASVNLVPTSTVTASPTLVLNGYNIVPNSTEVVTSFYGLFNNPPGTPGVIQGTQDFKVVDPLTGETVGTFAALVSNTNSFFVGGGTFQEIYVTEVDPGSENTPPVGTLISTVRIGRFGTFYTSTPTESGNVVSLKLLTPVGEFRVPWNYDGGLVFSAVSVPLVLTDDYYIAPAPGYDQTISSISGVPPFFTAAQGEQVFNVYQKAENEGDEDIVIGTFRGFVTTTSDAAGATTEAILVTEVISGTEGTGPGDVPPVGSVYNVIYRYDIFYSAIASPSGTVITSSIELPFIGTIPIRSHLDAAVAPAFDSLTVPGGYSFVPASEFQPSGINGLPPREVQIQGYEQFDVVDSDGHNIGSFDADVTTQWGPRGGYSKAILVTNVTDGTDGTGAGDVPPVGSQFMFHYFGHRGFGAFYSAIPSESGDVITFKILTPLGDIRIPARYNAVKGLEDVEYFNPFVSP